MTLQVAFLAAAAVFRYAKNELLFFEKENPKKKSWPTSPSQPQNIKNERIIPAQIRLAKNLNWQKFNSMGWGSYYQVNQLAWHNPAYKRKEKTKY